MPATTLLEITSHLASLGYTVAPDVKSPNNTVHVTHQDSFDFWVSFNDSYTTIFAFYGCSDYAREHPLEFLSTLNHANNGSSTTKYAVSQDEVFMMSCYAYGGYSKTVFHLLMEMWLEDAAKFASIKDIGRFFS